MRYYMKKHFLNLFYIALFVLSFLIPTLSQALGDQFNQQINEKIYVEPSSIYLASDSIYLNINDNLIPISAISADANGLYVTVDLETLREFQLDGRGIFGDETWTCKKCGYENYVGIDTCPVCGKNRWEPIPSNDNRIAKKQPQRKQYDKGKQRFKRTCQEDVVIEY